jgi:NitT/TauT family transport system permease protein
MEDIDKEIQAPTITSRRRRDRQTRNELIQSIWLPILSLLLLIILWQVLVIKLEVPEYIMPPPSDFLVRLFESHALLIDHMRRTAAEVILGFLAATLISIPLGFLVASVKVIERAFYPLIVFIQLTPKIAVAPLFIVWFGIGMLPKVLLTFLLCFFPTLVASMTGFKSLDEHVLYLTRSMGASTWQTFRYIRMPSALPYIFSGLRVSIVFAVTGAIVGEYVGANRGLGYLLLRGTSYLDTTLIFAVLIVLALMGLVFSYFVQASEQFVMPWKGKGERGE